MQTKLLMDTSGTNWHTGSILAPDLHNAYGRTEHVAIPCWHGISTRTDTAGCTPSASPRHEERILFVSVLFRIGQETSLSSSCRLQ